MTALAVSLRPNPAGQRVTATIRLYSSSKPTLLAAAPSKFPESIAKGRVARVSAAYRRVFRLQEKIV